MPQPLEAPDSKVASKAPAEPGLASNLLDLAAGIKKNVLAPAVNSLAIEPINAVANVANDALWGGTQLVNAGLKTHYEAPQVGKLSTMEVGNAESGSVAYYSQEVSSTVGSILAYAVAGKVAGKALRTVGEAAPIGLEIQNLQVGRALRQVAQDSRVATIVGATTYAGIRDTKAGETHLSNMVSTAVGFTAFEFGNSKILQPNGSLLERAGQRFQVGILGGVAQGETASLMTTGHLMTAQGRAAAAIDGGALNMLMPAGRHAVDEAAAKNPLYKFDPHVTETAAKLHIDAARAVPKGQTPERGSWADPAAIEAVKDASAIDLHTKLVVDNGGATRIDQNKNVIHVGKGDDALSVLQELAHRRIYKDPQYEQQFVEQAGRIKSSDPADPRNAEVKEAYVNTRLQQEVAAREAQNLEAVRLGSQRMVSTDASEIRNNEGYGVRFASEADSFIRDGGKFRPETDYAGFRYAHKDGTVLTVSGQTNGKFDVTFPDGVNHTVNLGEPVQHLRVNIGKDGTHNYHVNGRSQPQIIVNSLYNEVKVVAANGDKYLLTKVDGGGINLPFADGTTAELTGRGHLVVRTPDGRRSSVDLGQVPGRFSVVEREDGSKLFHIADAQATTVKALRIDPKADAAQQRREQTPRVGGPKMVETIDPDDPSCPPAVRAQILARQLQQRAARTPMQPRQSVNPRTNIQPRVPKQEGGVPGSPPSQTYYTSDFPEPGTVEDDRYPLRPNIFHDPVRFIEGVDQRALPGNDMSSPADVFLAQQGHYGPLEDHFAQLGRHPTDDPWSPW
ncbi:MAG TPA: hypothetical protein V6C97_09070 [Oculatellaceae cyanobacterium]